MKRIVIKKLVVNLDKKDLKLVAGNNEIIEKDSEKPVKNKIICSMCSRPVSTCLYMYKRGNFYVFEKNERIIFYTKDRNVAISKLCYYFGKGYRWEWRDYINYPEIDRLDTNNYFCVLHRESKRDVDIIYREEPDKYEVFIGNELLKNVDKCDVQEDIIEYVKNGWRIKSIDVKKAGKDFVNCDELNYMPLYAYMLRKKDESFVNIKVWKGCVEIAHSDTIIKNGKKDHKFHTIFYDTLCPKTDAVQIAKNLIEDGWGTILYQHYPKFPDLTKFNK